MPTKLGSTHCLACNAQRATTTTKPAHLVHGIIVAGGLLFPPLLAWAIVWLIAVLRPREERCATCGLEAGYRPKGTPAPTA